MNRETKDSERGVAKTVFIEAPSEKQKEFLRASTKHVGFGGARGGGKSWAVRTKAALLALRHPGIRILIVRRTYPELTNNHIRILRERLAGIAVYSDKEKRMTFPGGGSITFSYCDTDEDLGRMQGVEYDVIFIDEATQLTEYQMKAISACLRGTGDYPRRIYYTCNPGGRGHSYIKRIFIDRRYVEGEDPADYTFIRSLVTDNTALMQAQPTTSNSCRHCRQSYATHGCTADGILRRDNSSRSCATIPSTTATAD